MRESDTAQCIMCEAEDFCECFITMATKGKAGSDSKKPKDSGGKTNVYNKFIDFLKSPMWALPVMSFVEQRSIVFDKEQGDEKLYQQIHGEFRSMVDMLIQCFCDDIGIKPDEVSTNLKKEQLKERPDVEQSMLEPVLAAGDYKLFVHMMIRKNIELQLQALQMIEVMCGLIPAVLLPGGPEEGKPSAPAGDNREEDQERIILIQIMRQSKEEYEKEQKLKKGTEDAEMKAIQESLAEKERLEAAKKDQEQIVQQTMMLAITDGSEQKAGKTTRAASVTEADPTPTRATSAKNRSVSIANQGGMAVPPADLAKSAPSTGKTAAEIRAMMKDKSAPTTDDQIQKRQDYLRQQRDKLLNMKREARMKAFSEAEGEGKRSRPKTARAAKSALRGGRGGSEVTPKISEDVLAARKALAQKLKQEVIGMP